MRVMTLVGCTRLAIPVSGLGLVPSSALRSTSFSTVNCLGSQLERGSQNTIPHSYHLQKQSLNAVKPGDKRMQPYSAWAHSSKSSKTEGRTLGHDGLTCFKTHPPGPGENENPTGDWWSQETVPQLHHCFCTKSSFESVNGGFMWLSSPPQANKYVKWPLRPGSCSLDTEVIQETIRCHLERAGTQKEIASKGQTACSCSQGLTHPYLH